MWTAKNRARYNRDTLRYPSDVTEEEWAVIAPLIPAARRGGRKRSVNIREVFNGVLYLLSTGCQWRGERQQVGGDTGCERNCGYQPRNTPSKSPFNTLVRVCNNKCAPLCDHCICWRFTNRLLTT